MLDSRLTEIATAFMSAPIDRGGWDVALRKMAEQTGAAHGQLVAFGSDHAVPFSCITDVPAGWAEQFIAIDGGNPAVNWRVACIAAPFVVAFEKDYEAARARLKSDVYDDFASQHDMMNGCQTVLARDPSMFFGLAAIRGKSDGATTEDQRALFAAVAPFALSAVRMQIALEHKGAQLAAEVFDGLSALTFLLDGRGKVAAQSEEATKFLARPGCPLRLSGQRLTAVRANEDRALQEAIKHGLDGLTDAAPRIWLAAERVADGHICEIFQLPRREWSFGFEPRLMAVVRPLARQAEQTTAFLRTVMGLTPAEAEVARLLSEGHSREQIATLRGTSAGTVHAQIKSLFRKAEVNREGELVALVSRLLA